MHKQAHPLKAAAWMSGAIVSFTLMAIAGRKVSAELDTFEIMFYRSLLGAVLVVAVAAATGHLGDIRRDRLGLHLVRNLFHFTGQNLWFYAITVAPLAQVFALEFSQPLWVMILALFILGERMTGARILAALAGFAGILIITRPWAGALGAGVVPAALAAVGFAGSAVLTRFLTRTQRITSILFWLIAMQAALGLACAGADGQIALPSATILPWLAMIGLGGLVAHFCLTTALAMAPATVVIPIDFARLPVVAVVAYLVYGEPLEWQVAVGALLIFAANYMNIVVENRRNRSES